MAVSDYPGARWRWPASLLALRFPGLVRVARQDASQPLGGGHFAALEQPHDFAAQVARSVEAMADAAADARVAAAQETALLAQGARAPPRSAAKTSTYGSSVGSSSSGPSAAAGQYGSATSRGGPQRAAHGAVELGPPDLSTKTAKHPAGTLMYNPELHGSQRPKGGVYTPKEASKPQALLAR